jgi:hypothetical protein
VTGEIAEFLAPLAAGIPAVHRRAGHHDHTAITEEPRSGPMTEDLRVLRKVSPTSLGQYGYQRIKNVVRFRRNLLLFAANIHYGNA